MMEELVGKIWHQFITRAANLEHEQARVHLSDMQRTIEMLFRSGGGSPHVRVTQAADSAHGGTRTWLQRVAGSGTHAALPQLDQDRLALPPSIAVFDDVALNRDLYLWLSVLASCHHDTGQWVADNRWATECALRAYPGMQNRYERLRDAHLAQRPHPAQLKAGAADAERLLQQALCTTPPQLDLPDPPWNALQAKQVAPVWLWLHSSDPRSATTTIQRPHQEQDSAPPPRTHQATDKRRKAHHTEDAADHNGMMMFFRAESIMSWAEHVKVNRQTDDEDDGSALKAADDMDSLALAPDGQSTAGRIKFDLDLPSAAQDDQALGPGVHLPEWHWKTQTLVNDHCCAQLLEAKQPAPFEPAPGLQIVARRMRRKLEILRDQPRHLHAQHQGDELDLDAWVQWHTQRRAMTSISDNARIYSQRQKVERSLSCLLLADLSLSTDAWANNEQRVIDVIRDALYVFGEALNGLGDPFAMLGFSSVRRQHVRMHLLKRFQEAWTPQVQARVGAIKPGYYTRMGAAIRYAVKGLSTRPERQRLLLLLTDGKPNDLDVYEGRHGLEDTRQAVLEAKAAGLIPFCVTIDQEAHDYLPALFGQHGFTVVHNPAELTTRLSAVYAQLATHKGV